MGPVCHSGSHPGPVTFTHAPIAVSLLLSAVFTIWVPVPVIPICSSILPVTERHYVESGTVSRPIAATCNVTAAMWDQSTLYSRSRGITTAVTPAPGSPAGQKIAVGPEGLLPLLLPRKTLGSM